MPKQDTKTVKLKDGKTVEVPLYGFSANLSDDSMAGSDEDGEGSRLKDRRVKRKVLSRREVLKNVKRRSSSHRCVLSPSDAVDNPIRKLLGEDFDIPAFYRKEKSNRKESKAANLVTKMQEGSEEEIEEIEEDNEEDEVLSSPGLKLRRPRRVFLRREYEAGTSSGHDSASTRSLPRPRKRPASTALSDTESEGTQSRPPATKPRVETLHKASSPVTTESEEEVHRPPKAAALSDTESEEESLPLKPVDPLSGPLSPRPAFKATPEQQQKAALVLDDAAGIQVPRYIAMYLRPYQEEGVKFFWERYKEGGGGILGDDMGLGKTIQVISFLSAIFRKSGNKSDETRRYDWVNDFLDSHEIKDLPDANAQWPTCLIIAPMTVVENWEREIMTWSYFETGVLSGSAEDRAATLKSFKMGRYDVLLASHDTTRIHISELESLKFSCIFVDEAHKIKNDKTQTAQAYNRFECQIRFGLSGTVIQNSYKEIWPLLNWSNPGRVGTEKQWNQFIVRPMLEGQSKDATEEALLDFRELTRRFVHNLLPVFFLRRTKDIIKDQLPKKTDKVVFCPLTKTQVQVYERFLATEDVQLMLRKDEPCDCRSGKRRGQCHYRANSEGVEWHKLLLKYIDVLIKISNSLLLIYPGPEDSSAQVERNRALMKIAFPGKKVGTYASALMNKELCGKWGVLSKLLTLWRDEKEKKNKVLIFSKSVKLLDFLSMWLDNARFNFRQLHGKVKQEDRFRAIDEFNLDPEVFVFLISTMTGGTGLNLVAANKVVIFDPNWNPAHDLQAMDRAYRFGQQRDVMVYRLLGAGSLEELVYARQLYKQQQMRIGYDASHQTRLFAGVQGNTAKQGELFGLKNILTLRRDLSTKEQIEDAHVGNLEWALANTEAGNDAEDDASQMEKLLLDEEFSGQAMRLVERQALKSENNVDDILNTVGVKYTHENAHILRDNHVEAKIFAKAREARRMSKTLSKKADSDSDVAAWPPKRPHHQDVDPNTRRLQSRKEAILAKGYDLATYAQEFASLTPDQQAARLRELDVVAES